MNINPPPTSTSDGPAPEAPTLMQVDQICNSIEGTWKNTVVSHSSFGLS
jgi:hypothetical protein